MKKNGRVKIVKSPFQKKIILNLILIEYSQIELKWFSNIIFKKMHMLVIKLFGRSKQYSLKKRFKKSTLMELNLKIIREKYSLKKADDFF